MSMAEIDLPHNHGHEMDAIISMLPYTEDFMALADVFKQLGDSSRLRIFWLLCHCEECVINISALMDMSSPAVSHHLKQLRSCGLIVSRRNGKEVYYKAAETKQTKLLHDVIENMADFICAVHRENDTE